MSKGSPTILVIGGSSGIGQATVKLLESNDNDVYVVDKCFGENSSPVDPERFFEIDITNKDAVQKLCKIISEKKVTFRAVVVTAGVHHSGPIERLPDELIHRVMEVNFLAQVSLLRDLIPFLEQPGGRIVSVSSLAGMIGLPMSSIYSSSKAALEVFLEALSVELDSRGVYVSIIQPGNVNTGFNEKGNTARSDLDSRLSSNYARFLAKIHSSNGMPAHTVAKVIQKVVDKPKPKLCYIVGINAYKAYFAKKLLGRSTALFLLKKSLGFR